MPRTHDREILRLAVPAFLALVAEPLFLLADAAIVGHLGTAQLAGHGIAAVVLQTVVGLCIFLAYGTTASVARHVGAGDLRGALAQGIDGIWLAVGSARRHRPRRAADRAAGGRFGADAAVNGFATTYLRHRLPRHDSACSSCSRRPGCCAGSRTPAPRSWSRSVGNALNVVLNLVLVYGAGPFGGMASPARRSAPCWRRSRARPRCCRRGARRPARARLPAAGPAGHPRRRPRGGGAGRPHDHPARRLLVTTYAVVLGAAADDERVALATHQIAITLWTFLAFVLDAIAIAAQALTGRYLGAGDVRAPARSPGGWSSGGRRRCGVRCPARRGQPVPRGAVHPRPGGARPAGAGLVVAALGQPIAGVVFVLDGVLIGAGDGTYLAWAGSCWSSTRRWSWPPRRRRRAGGVWVVFSAVFMGAPLVVLARRALGDAWLVTGVVTQRST